MTIIQLGEWTPDQSDFANPGSLVATNVVPTANGYAPFPELNVVTNALDARPRGAISARATDGNVYQYAGDAAKLYTRQTQTWTDVSKVGGYTTAADENWEFVHWNNKILGVNWDDNPQQITLGGANFSDLTTALKARHIAVVGDFVVMGNTSDVTDGEMPNRVRWSAISDETDWTVSASTLSDFQDLKTGGAVRHISGGEYGVIVLERSVWRMTFVGSPTVFQFDEVLPNIGTIVPESIVRDGETVYMLSERGFFAIRNGTQATPIGANRVDKFVLDDIDLLNAHRMSVVADANNNRILWAYPGAGSTEGRPNKIIIYDRSLDKWSLVEKEIELLFRAAGVGTTLDALDTISSSIDDLGASLDSAQWKGGVAQVNAFDTAFKSGAFDSATNMPATIDTKESELNSGRRTRLTAFRPIVDGGTVTAKVGTRDRQADTVSFGTSLSLRNSGRFTTRENSRYYRFRLEITGDWSDAIGVDISRDEARGSERRG